MTVRSAELGTPFNAEVERLRGLVAHRRAERVSASACMTEVGPDDPGPRHGRGALRQRQGAGPDARPEPLHLRPPRPAAASSRSSSTSATSGSATPARTEFQVRVGQGEVEYGRLVTPTEQGPLRPGPVRRHGRPCEGVDHDAEMRKMRLLLESLL